MIHRYLSALYALGMLALAGCQSRDAPPEPPARVPLMSSIVFQADLVGCKRSVLNLYRQTGPSDFEPVDRFTLVHGKVRDYERDLYDARTRWPVTHVRGMVPGKYHVRGISCGNKAPRNEFAIASFDVVEGRAAYIGKLVVGKQKGRVLMRVDNEAQAAHEAIKLSHPELVPRYGVRLMVSQIPTRS